MLSRPTPRSLWLGPRPLLAGLSLLLAGGLWAQSPSPGGPAAVSPHLLREAENDSSRPLRGDVTVLAQRTRQPGETVSVLLAQAQPPPRQQPSPFEDVPEAPTQPGQQAPPAGQQAPPSPFEDIRETPDQNPGGRRH